MALNSLVNIVEIFSAITPLVDYRTTLYLTNKGIVFKSECAGEEEKVITSLERAPNIAGIYEMEGKLEIK